jgi:transcriptional regulator with XRE-family HTH domain
VSIYAYEYTGMMCPLTFRVRELRERAGWSQEQLARRSGVRQATISGLETGRIRRVQLDILERLGTALGVDAASLLVSSRPTRRGT